MKILNPPPPRHHQIKIKNRIYRRKNWQLISDERSSWKKEEKKYKDNNLVEAKKAAKKITQDFVKKSPTFFPPPGPERKKEIENFCKKCEKEILTNLEGWTAEKEEIKSRIMRELTKRCGEESAKSFVDKIDFKGEDAKCLTRLLIELVQKPKLCCNPEKRKSEWKSINIKYFSKQSQQKKKEKIELLEVHIANLERKMALQSTTSSLRL